MSVLKKSLLLLVAAACVLLNGAAAFYLLDEGIHYGRIHTGVRVYGMSVARMSKDEAQTRIDAKVKAVYNTPLMITYGSKKWTAGPTDFQAKADMAGTADKAYRQGRTGSVVRQIEDRFGLYINPVSIPVTSKLRSLVVAYITNVTATAVDRPAQNASLKIEGTEIEAIKAKDGQAVDKRKLAEGLSEHMVDFTSRTFQLPVDAVPVEVHDNDTGQARKTAVRMMKAPVEVTIGDIKFELSRDDIGQIIDFVPGQDKKGGGKYLRAVLSKPRLEESTAAYRDQVETPPKDAGFEAGDGVVTIIPSVNGTVIDFNDAQKRMTRAVMSEAPRSAEFKLTFVEPARTTEKAQKMGIKERVSTHTEYFGYTAERSKNIGLLAEAIDGMIVAPNEVYSLNASTGPRTKAKGYQDAPVIVNGQLSPDVGGGICNVSTTIFNTAFFGGYEIVERHPHDFYIDHYPAGRDASVYYDGDMDFKFRNDSPYYILIKTGHGDDYVTVSFYSTSIPDQEVSYDDTGFTNIVPFGITYKEDPTMPIGWEKEGELGYGVDGRDITVTRVVKRSGKVVHDDKFLSHYEPKNRVVLRGTAPALAPGAPPPVGATPYVVN